VVGFPRQLGVASAVAAPHSGRLGFGQKWAVTLKRGFEPLNSLQANLLEGN
jgi:hypothetical protein